MTSLRPMGEKIHAGVAAGPERHDSTSLTIDALVVTTGFDPRSTATAWPTQPLETR